MSLQALRAFVGGTEVARLLVPAAALAFAISFQCAGAASTDSVSAEESARQAARYFSFGHFEEAIRGWSRAADGFAGDGDTDGQIRALLGKANAYLALGRYPDAISALEGARARAREIGDADLSILVNASLGNAYLLAGRADEAGTVLGAVITEARASGRHEGERDHRVR